MDRVKMVTELASWHKLPEVYFDHLTDKSLQNWHTKMLEGKILKEAKMGKCDPEDIICRADLLAKMRNLRGAFDDLKFKEKYPSLVELAPKLDEAIKSEETSLGADLGACELLPLPEPGKEESSE